MQRRLTRRLASLRGDMRVFDDRVDAGRQLAERLESLRGQDVVVLGLPRGGVPVAFEVAKALRAPLDVLVVRKLGVPFQPELAFGAIGEGGVRVINESVVREADLSEDDMAAVEASSGPSCMRRVERFRRGRGHISLAGRVAVSSMTASRPARPLRRPARWPVPWARAGWCWRFRSAPTTPSRGLAGYADEVVCLHMPEFF